MIRLQNVRKSFVTGGSQKVVARNITATFPTGVAVALLGRNGAGKSTLLSMIAGTMEPSSGTITSTGTISWPVGFAGSFHRDLTGAQNTRFVARVYGVDTDALSAFVEDFAELGGHFHMPLRTYSSGMKSRLSFGVSMGIRFDTYLIDEVTSVGDAAFKQKSGEVFLERIRQSGAILVSHGLTKVRKLCSAGAVLENGILTYFDDVEEAIWQHRQNMGISGDDDDDDDDD
jgi:capsular polysaccharide transport system ATP-binding protein